MKKYEAMVIFNESLKDTELDGAVETVRGEVEKLGGKVTSATRMGMKEFVRTMQKQNKGHYVLLAFQLDGSKVGAFQARLKLNGQVFRVQVVNAPAEKPAAAKEGGDGVAE